MNISKSISISKYDYYLNTVYVSIKRFSHGQTTVNLIFVFLGAAQNSFSLGFGVDYISHAGCSHAHSSRTVQ